MVIQRWQSVWLLVAAILVAFFSFMPLAYISTNILEIADANPTDMIYPSDNIVILILGILIPAVLIIDIFHFKDFRRQKMLTIMSILLIVIYAVSNLLILYVYDKSNEVNMTGSILLLVGSVIAALLAYRGINHDEKLLKAADRLR